MRRSASEVIRNLERRIARLERSTMKKASSMPSEAKEQLLDEIYDETGIDFDAIDVRVLDAKHIGGGLLGSSIFLVEVGKETPRLFAVVKCEMDEPGGESCDVLEIVRDQRSALRTFKSAR